MHTLLVRGILLSDNHVLLVRLRNSHWTFLPGGHVEDGECFVGALHREIQEELGRKCVVRDYLGAVEHAWNRKPELNHMFSIEIPEMTPLAAIHSSEPHLQFLWAEVRNLQDYYLSPDLMVELIQRYAKGSKTAYWGSTITLDGNPREIV